MVATAGDRDQYLSNAAADGRTPRVDRHPRRRQQPSVLFPLPLSGRPSTIMLYHFHTSIHAYPDGEIARQEVFLHGTSYDALHPSTSQQAIPLSVQFDEAVERLKELPRMFIELDGAFVWRDDQQTDSWQLDGCLYDRDQHVVYVDVVGRCPPREFDRLLRCLKWPESRLLFQLPRHATFLDEASFRRYASHRGD